jgi:hypothetical protein
MAIPSMDEWGHLEARERFARKIAEAHYCHIGYVQLTIAALAFYGAILRLPLSVLTLHIG